ncbi:MAG TPA: tRNA lysidine(34) synthetase TilS [Micavibrio sp.]
MTPQILQSLSQRLSTSLAASHEVPGADVAPITAPITTPIMAAEFGALAVMDAVPDGGSVAVALSGGPDSMALLALIEEWAAPRDVTVLALTIDHALRAESAAEAAQVQGWVCQYFPRVVHHIIRRDQAALSPTKLQEQARADRYRLMADACAQAAVPHLFLAHHRDDQAETFLMRLCKGSGLDGLAGMSAHVLRGDLHLLRPLLGFDKARLVVTCAARGLPYVNDPSNGNNKFARVRLRGLTAALAREGLSARRLAATALRMGRARAALEFYAGQLWAQSLCADEATAGALVFDWHMLCAAPEDMRVRVLMRALAQVGAGSDGNSADRYGPRLEQVEALAAALFPRSHLSESGRESGRDLGGGSGAGDVFVRTTLHQCIVERSAARGRLLIRAEKAGHNACRG